MKPHKIPEKLKLWFEARSRHRLSDAHVQMARELGLNPKKMGGYDNHRQETWKASLPDFIEEIYRKRFGVDRPECVRSLEDIIAAQAAKKQQRRENRRLHHEGT